MHNISASTSLHWKLTYDRSKHNSQCTANLLLCNSLKAGIFWRVRLLGSSIKCFQMWFYLFCVTIYLVIMSNHLIVEILKNKDFKICIQEACTELRIRRSPVWSSARVSFGKTLFLQQELSMMIGIYRLSPLKLSVTCRDGLCPPVLGIPWTRKEWLG